MTYEEAFELVFDNPDWEYFKWENDAGSANSRVKSLHIVEFTGTCIYRGVKCEATIQFGFNLDIADDAFLIGYMAFGNYSFNKEEREEELDRIFKEASDIKISMEKADEEWEKGPEEFITFRKK